MISVKQLIVSKYHSICIFFEFRPSIKIKKKFAGKDWGDEDEWEWDEEEEVEDYQSNCGIKTPTTFDGTANFRIDIVITIDTILRPFLPKKYPS